MFIQQRIIDDQIWQNKVWTNQFFAVKKVLTWIWSINISRVIWCRCRLIDVTMIFASDDDDGKTRKYSLFSDLFQILVLILVYRSIEMTKYQLRLFDYHWNESSKWNIRCSSTIVSTIHVDMKTESYRFIFFYWWISVKDKI